MKGAEIKELRDILNVTKAEFTRISGVSPRELKYLEDGERQITAELFHKMKRNVEGYLFFADLAEQQKERITDLLAENRPLEEYTLPGEEWKTVPDFENYLCSNLGRVWNKSRQKPVPIHVTEWRFIKCLSKPRKTKRKYYRVQLYNRETGELKPFVVHRLVALVWIPNDDPEHKTIVDHIDNDPMNNMVSNLRWVTNGQNIKNSYTNEQAYTRWLIEKTQDSNTLNNVKVKNVSEII